MKARNSAGAFLLMILFATGCHSPYVVHNTLITEPAFPFTPAPPRLFVANAYDIRLESYREKKEKLFVHLSDVVMQTIANRVGRLTTTTVTMIPQNDVLPRHADSVALELLREFPTSHAILIKHLNAEFEQTEVEVTETDSGKERQAFYDIIVEVTYRWLRGDGVMKDTTISVRRFHSSRQVLSGLFAAGPDIVANSDDALEGAQANADRLLRNFFPTEERRTRRVFVHKDFERIGVALGADDFKSAFDISVQLTSSSDRGTAARAYYNCAVLLEHQGALEEAGMNLKEALRLQPNLVDALTMIEDY